MKDFLTLQSAIILVGSLITNFILALLWAQWEQIRPLIARFEKYTPALITTALISIWVFIFFLYKFPVTGDVVSFFIPQATKAFNGQLPNRDFSSSYMPLFPYVMGVFYFMYQDDRTLGLFFTVCVCAFAFLLFHLLQKTQNTRDNNPALLMAGLINSVIWVLGVGYQQDEIYILLLIGLLFIAFEKKSDLFTGVLAGFVLLATKITVVVFWLPFFLLSEKKMKFAAGLCISLIPAITLLVWLGFSPARMIKVESVAVMPPNLISAFQFIPPVYPFFSSHPLLPYLASAIALGGFVIFIIQRKVERSFQNLMALITIIWLTILILSLKSLTSYRLLIIPFIPFILEVYRQKWKWIPAGFAVYCTLLSVHYMFYEDWGKISKIYLTATTIPTNQLPQYIALTVIEISITLIEILLVYLSARLILLPNQNARSKA